MFLANTFDFSGLSRLVPEIAILIVCGWFVLKMLRIGNDFIQKNDERHTKMFDTLNESVRKNTESTDRMNGLVKETVTYLKHRNGTFEALIKDAPALHELAKNTHNKKEN